MESEALMCPFGPILTHNEASAPLCGLKGTVNPSLRWSCKVDVGGQRPSSPQRDAEILGWSVSVPTAARGSSDREQAAVERCTPLLTMYG